MDHKLARSLFMDYIYEEMDNKQRLEFEKYVSQHPDLQEELKELGDVRSILSFLPVEEPTEKLVIVPPTHNKEATKPASTVWQLNSYAKYAIGVAACFLMIFMGASISNMMQPPVQQGYTEAQVQQIIAQTVDQVREDNAEFVSQFINASLNQQKQEFDETLLNLAAAFENRRIDDLKLISASFDRITQSTLEQFAQADQKFRRTDQVLGDIIETVSSE